MTTKLNRCYFQTASAGAGSFVYAETEAGFHSPVSAGAIDGESFYYIAEVLTGGIPTQWELGVGTWTTDTLTRSALESSNGGLAVDFSDPPKVRMGVPLAADWPVIRFLVAGDNVTIDATDPEAPIVSAAGGGGDTPNQITTDNMTPVEIDTSFVTTEITTDGSGLEQVVQLPSLTAEEVGRPQLVILSVQTDPGDTVRITGGPVEVILDTLNDHARFEYGGPEEGRWALLYGSMTFDEPSSLLQGIDNRGVPELRTVADVVDDGLGSIETPIFQFLASGNFSGIQLVARNANDIDTFEELTLTGGGESINTNVYRTLISSGGTAGVEPLSIGDGNANGHRHDLFFSNQSDPGDVPTLDTSKIIDGSGVTPASVTFNTAGDALLIEWQSWRDSNNGKWVIIGASDGVVSLI